MATLADGRTLEEPGRADRSAIGADRYDEVWDGVYSMSPLPDLEHQEITTKLAMAFQLAIGWMGPGKVLAGAIVSDREEGWEQNNRVPDVVVYFTGGKARPCGTHLCGGPDLVVETTSPRDRSREKLSFYSRLGVRELLLIDRDAWSLELFQLQGDQLILTGRSSIEQPTRLTSAVLPLSFLLVKGAKRPEIEVAHTDGVQKWRV
jgi:Uma2 family endonuclease